MIKIVKLSRKNANEYIGLLLNLVLIIPLIIPEGLGYLSPEIYNVIYNYWKKIAQIIIVGLFMISFIHDRKITPITLSGIVMVAVSFICNIYNNGNYAQWQSNFMICVYTCFLIEYNKKALIRIIGIFRIILDVFIVINLVCMFRYPDGMYISRTTNYHQNWFLGYKSSLQYYVIPAACLSWLDMKYSGKKIRFFSLMVLCLLEVYMSENMMLLVGFIVFLLAVIFKISDLTMIFNIKNYTIAVLLSNIIIVFSNTWFVGTSLGSLFLLVVGRGATLTWRTSVIWPNTLSAIANNLFIGNGVLAINERIHMYRGVYGAIHAHNQLLELFFIGGLFLVAAYIIFHFYVYRQLNNNKDLATSKVLALTIFVIYLMVTVEVFLRPIASPVWFILLLGFFCKELDQQYKEKYPDAVVNRSYKNRKFRIRRLR